MRYRLLFAVLAAVFFGGTAVRSQASFRLEAEEVIVNRDALRKDRMKPDTWNYWTTDRNARKKWSGNGIVIQSPPVPADRVSPSDGAPPLHVVIPLPDEGPWRIELRGPGRPIGFSTDGRTYRKITAGPIVRQFRAEKKQFECWFDDLFAAERPEQRGSTYLDCFVVTREKHPVPAGD